MSGSRGPRRTIVAIEYGTLPTDIGSGDAWVLSLDCSHVSYGNPAMHHTIGGYHHCLTCKRSEVVR